MVTSSEESRMFSARLYSISSSAATCFATGTLRPSAFAVLRFMANWNVVGR